MKKETYKYTKKDLESLTKEELIEGFLYLQLENIKINKEYTELKQLVDMYTKREKTPNAFNVNKSKKG